MARLLALIVTFGLVLTSVTKSDDSKSKALFNGKDLTGWRVYVSGKAKSDAAAENVWKVKDGVLECAGKPAGYLITEEDYGDYVLELEWKWPAKAGNSGVLLHCSGKDMIWPKSAEAQLFAGSAGDIWLIGGFKLDVDKSRQDPRQARHFFRMDKEKAVEKPVGQWNKYRITCKGKSIKLEVNGKFVNEGENSELSKGKIALQSEGAPIHFRNVRITPLK